MFCVVVSICCRTPVAGFERVYSAPMLIRGAMMGLSLPKIFAGRFALAARFLLVYLLMNAAIRLGLLLFNGDFSLLKPTVSVPIFGIGALFDMATGVWWLIPFALLAVLWPSNQKLHGIYRVVAAALVLVCCGGLAFVAASEFVFWNEFASRFNFIAVDYLIYTREVIGNIRESYDLRPAFVGIAVLTALLFSLHWRALRSEAMVVSMTIKQRLRGLSVFIALPLLSFGLVDPRFKEFSIDNQAVQLAGNGHYEFFSAFRNNEINYAQFYRTDEPLASNILLRSEFEHLRSAGFTPDSAMPIEREVVGQGPEKRLNVVLISVESLSADFMGTFGNTKGLTPNLDKLAKESMLFTQLYATGVRTVRGLEAIALSIPPTPGNSIVKRPNNENLFSLGGVFKDKGYEPMYMYGGYGYFDNMSAFFGNNGYTVLDRTIIPKEAIHYENIWGVADEDLYTMALGQLDQRHAAKRPFFAHIMTTSNHRPYTYPEGRIDIPSLTGRDGGVKYTDWAIGDFIERARQHAWFDDTVFVILADHTASGRGKTDLPIENFHIPMLIWSPKHIAPARIDTLASQIDTAPTLLALLNFSYRSKFFGHDIIRDGPGHPRALMANYQTVGYLEDGILVELRPRQTFRIVDAASGKERAADEVGMKRLAEAVSYYQAASEAYRSGTLSRGDAARK